MVIFVREKRNTHSSLSDTSIMIYNNKEPYTKEQIQEIKTWYEAHEAELPAEVELCKGEVCKDLPKMMKSLFATAEDQLDNPTFKRLLQYLFDIKQKVEQS